MGQSFVHSHGICSIWKLKSLIWTVFAVFWTLNLSLAAFLRYFVLRVILGSIYGWFRVQLDWFTVYSRLVLGSI